MKNACKFIIKWCLIIMLVGLIVKVSPGVTFILLAIILYRWAIKGIPIKSSLKSGTNATQKVIDKIKD